MLLTPISRRNTTLALEESSNLPQSNTLISLKKQMENLEKVFFIVDALDECPENKRRNFLHLLDKLPPSINVFLTSRDDIHPQMDRKCRS